MKHKFSGPLRVMKKPYPGSGFEIYNKMSSELYLLSSSSKSEEFNLKDIEVLVRNIG